MTGVEPTRSVLIHCSDSLFYTSAEDDTRPRLRRRFFGGGAICGLEQFPFKALPDHGGLDRQYAERSGKSEIFAKADLARIENVPWNRAQFASSTCRYRMQGLSRGMRTEANAGYRSHRRIDLISSIAATTEPSPIGRSVETF